MAPKARVTVTVNADLVESIQRLVDAGEVLSLSGWVSEAIELRHDRDARLAALADLVAQYEVEFGEITEDEMRRQRDLDEIESAGRSEISGPAAQGEALASDVDRALDAQRRFANEVSSHARASEEAAIRASKAVRDTSERVADRPLEVQRKKSGEEAAKRALEAGRETAKRATGRVADLGTARPPVERAT